MATIGWDVGGAHLKAALAESGRLQAVVQLPCPLWQGLENLENAVAQVLAAWPAASRHALTMTGELADLFHDRAHGVALISELMASRLAPAVVEVYAGRAGWVPASHAARQVEHVASANWLASVEFAAKTVPNALFIDIGSTTADIVPIADGAPASVSITDADRLTTGELVYTGVVRTPVCAVARRAPFRGQWQTLAAEVFATMADVYRLLDALPEGADQLASADGRGKSKAESSARLARMLGRDAGGAEPWEWRQLAAYLARRQQGLIQESLDLLLSRVAIATDAPVIAAGVGRFLAKRLADNLARATVEFGALCGVQGLLAEAAGNCAPAAALALLASGSV